MQENFDTFSITTIIPTVLVCKMGVSGRNPIFIRGFLRFYEELCRFIPVDMGKGGVHFLPWSCGPSSVVSHPFPISFEILQFQSVHSLSRNTESDRFLPDASLFVHDQPSECFLQIPHRLSSFPAVPSGTHVFTGNFKNKRPGLQPSYDRF